MKKIKFFAGLLALLAAFFVLTATASSSASSKDNTVNVTYTLQQNKKQFASKKVQVKSGANVLTGLKKGWKVKVADKDMVTSIDGKSQNNKKKIYWTYTINGKSSNKSVLQQTVKNNDHVVFNLGKMSN